MYISDVLTALAYGDAHSARILAPVMDWNLKDTTLHATKQIQHRFLSSPPPVIFISRYEGAHISGVFLDDSRTVAVEPGCSGFPRGAAEADPLKPTYDLRDVCDVAVNNLGFHICHNSHNQSRNCIYFSDSLVQLFVDVYDTNIHSTHQSSFLAVLAAVKITLVHELAHFFVMFKEEVGHSSPLYITLADTIQLDWSPSSKQCTRWLQAIF